MADLPAGAAWAADSTEGNFKYKVNDDGTSVTVTGLVNETLADGKLEIPATLGGNTVTAIGDSAFKKCKELTSVSLPASLQSIGEYAFKGCGLTSITLPASLTSLGHGAFYGCSALKTVTFPEHCQLMEIPGSAFNSCSALTSITIPNNVTSIDDNAFAYCSALQNIKLPESLETVGKCAFAECSKLTSITLPANLQSIGELAFMACGSADNPLKIKSADAQKCALVLKQMADDVSAYPSADYANVDVQLLDVDGDGADCEYLADTDFAYLTFADNTALLLGPAEGADTPAKLNVPAAVQNDGGKNYTVTAIAERAFAEEPGGTHVLESITLPASLQSMGYGAFEQCANLTSVTFVEGCKLTEIPSGAFNWCASLGSIELPANVTKIDVGAFLQCEDLTSVTLPEGLTSIENEAFSHCAALTSVTLPASVASVGFSAFGGCTSLEVIITGDKLVGNIGDNAFHGVPAVKCDTPEMCDYLENQADMIGGGTSFTPKRLYKLADAELTCAEPFYIYTGTPLKPQITVRITENGQTITFAEGKDYTVAYAANTEWGISTGQATATATADGRLVGSNVLKFTILNENQSLWLYYKNDGTDEFSPHPTIATEGEKMFLSETAPFPAPAGKVFTGYLIDGVEYAPGAEYIVPAPNAGHEIKVLTVWRDGGFIVRYDANGGTGEMPPQEVAPGGAYQLPACGFTAPTGQIFKIWQIDGADYAVNAPYSVQKDTVVKAIWQDKTPGVRPEGHYRIDFELDGGELSNGAESPAYVAPATEYTMPYAAKSGYTLRHWAIGAADSAYNVKANDPYKFTADTTVYAIWSKNSGGGGGGSHRPGTGTTTPTKPTTPTTPDKPGTPGTPAVTAQNINSIFADVRNGAWYAEAIAYVYNKGMMNGTEKGFEPNASTTRAMLVTMLFRLENEPASGAAKFSDVAGGQWFSEAVAWAAGVGVVNGYADGKFGPNDAITREQLAAVLYRYAQLNGLDVSAKGSLGGFRDQQSVSGWAVEAMQWAVGAGIINGDDGALKPTGNATRAEVAMMLMRYIEQVK